MDAGRYWVLSSGSDDDEPDAEFEAHAFGIEDPKFLEATKEEIFWLWEEHLEALELFGCCSTQWRTNAMGGLQGLDYGGVETVMRIQQINRGRQKHLFSELQDIERGALRALNELRNRK